MARGVRQGVGSWRRWRGGAAFAARGFAWLPALLLAGWLAACGGGGAGDPPDAGGPAAGTPTAPPPEAPPAETPPPEAPPAPAPPLVVEEPAGPGRTLAVERLKTITVGQVRDALAALAASGAPVPPLAPAYDVVAWRLTYVTRDIDGREVAASGLLAVPAKAAGAPSPVLSWQHGTLFRDAAAPSNALAPGETPIVLASTGYLVVAADYVGYGASRGLPHPYLLSAPTASAVLDLLVAARHWRLRQRVPGNGQLFLAGFSEGGYATVAAHRALQASAAGPDEAATVLAPERAELVAAVPGAGPMHLSATLDQLLEQIRDDNPILGALVDPGFLRHLGGSVRNEVRRQLVRRLLPADSDVVIDTRFIDPFLEDDRDRIERDSNVHDWRPATPVRLFHGRDDRVVPYASSATTLAAMLARGASDVTLVDCTAAPAGHLECWPGYLAHLLGVLGERARDL